MFNCVICKATSSPNEKSVMVVLERRAKTYPWRRDANTFVRFAKKTHSDDPGGVGQETVKEGLAHRQCASEYEAINR